MNRHGPIPTEGYLGTMQEREDLLRREALSGRAADRMRRWVRTMAGVAFVLLILFLLAAAEWGPGTTIGWIGTYLVPVVAILTVGFCVLLLLVRLTKKLPGGHDLSDWWQ